MGHDGECRITLSDVSVAVHNARFCNGARRDERARGYYRDALSCAFEELLEDAKHHNLGAMSLETVMQVVRRVVAAETAHWPEP